MMNQRVSMVLLFSVLLIVNSNIISASEIKTSASMQVHFIDVGQGDSTLIETPNGKTILIDGGPPSKGQKLVTYLKKQRITTIDLLITTHPDIDHLGGLIDVIKNVKVNKILDSGKLYYTATYREYLRQIKRHNIPVAIAQPGEKLEIDPSLSIDIWNGFSGTKNNNQSSIVLSLNYKKVDFLLMGDAEVAQEKRLANSYNVQSEIIKVGHHGSATSSSLQFLEQVQPQTAILSYDKDNDYGHPVPQSIDNLLQVGATVFSTAKVGNIVIETDGYTYKTFYSGKDRVIDH